MISIVIAAIYRYLHTSIRDSIVYHDSISVWLSR